jgi:hypothetical protein
MKISAYLDESGVHEGAAVCVIAGYFGSREQWRKFKTIWRRVLKVAAVPINEFHALDLIEHRKFFFGMPRDKHREFIDKLTSTIVDCEVHPVAFGLVVADFKALSLPQKRFFTGATINDSRKPGKLVTTGAPSKPYFMPFLQCVKRILNYAGARGTAHLNFGLDRPFANYAVTMLKMIKDNPKKPHSAQLGNALFPEAKNNPQLQAADFLSYLTYRHMLDRHAVGDWNVLPPHPLGTLLRRALTREDFLFSDKDVMQNVLEQTYSLAGNWDRH